MKLPTHLSHIPVICMENRDETDEYEEKSTDPCFVSLGRASWSGDEFVPGIKVMRNCNGKWSGQSEETTINRALDMAYLVERAYDYFVNGNEAAFSEEADGISLCKYAGSQENVDKLREYFLKHKDEIGGKINR